MILNSEHPTKLSFLGANPTCFGPPAGFSLFQPFVNFLIPGFDSDRRF